MINPSRTIARQCFLGGALRLCREAWYWKFVEISTDLQYLIF